MIPEDRQLEEEVWGFYAKVYDHLPAFPTDVELKEIDF